MKKKTMIISALIIGTVVCIGGIVAYLSTKESFRDKWAKQFRRLSDDIHE